MSIFLKDTQQQVSKLLRCVTLFTISKAVARRLPILQEAGAEVKGALFIAKSVKGISKKSYNQYK